MTQPAECAVLFVCMGNICRSPTAEGMFRKLHHDIAPELPLHVDSAGTHAYHIGEPPDERAVLAARRRGIDIAQHRGRAIDRGDFERFHFILGMDHANMRNLRKLKPNTSGAEIYLLRQFDMNELEQEVPDPYYSGPEGFEKVLDLVEQSSIGLLKFICGRRGIAINVPKSER